MQFGDPWTNRVVRNEGRSLIIERRLEERLRRRGLGGTAQYLPTIVAKSRYFGRLAPDPVVGGTPVPVLVFRTVGRSRLYDLFVRPARHPSTGGRTLVVFEMCVRERITAELFTPEAFQEISGSAKVEWQKPMSLDDAGALPPGSYIYALEERLPNGKWVPYYVGEAKRGNSAKVKKVARFGDHRRDMLRHKVNLNDRRVRVGKVTDRHGLSLKNVERVAIRAAINKHGKPQITNDGSDAAPVLLRKGKKVRVVNSGPRPAFLRGPGTGKRQFIPRPGPNGKYEYEYEINGAGFAESDGYGEGEGSYVGMAGWGGYRDA